MKNMYLLSYIQYFLQYVYIEKDLFFSFIINFYTNLYRLSLSKEDNQFFHNITFHITYGKKSNIFAFQIIIYQKKKLNKKKTIHTYLFLQLRLYDV